MQKIQGIFALVKLYAFGVPRHLETKEVSQIPKILYFKIFVQKSSNVICFHYFKTLSSNTITKDKINKNFIILMSKLKRYNDYYKKKHVQKPLKKLIQKKLHYLTMFI